MPEPTQRRLAAIVSADVVGYSRLMGADEAGTLASLRAHRAELIDPAIAEHDGRLVKTMGDGLLLEFLSVVSAVNFATAVQRAMAARNHDIPDQRRITFRIGINLGDIAIEGDDIFGDGVNVAARLQEACTAGGVALSGIAHESLGSLLNITFADGGEQQFKNIERSIRVWHWTPEAALAPAPAIADEPLALPDKPSIAVLPFENMSGDPEQEYFSDGLTEDIITGLSRIRWLFVIARNSSFTYKGQAVDVKRVGQELGVRYVLEGSVRKAGDRVRVTAQLVEADTGNHVWAERYDRQLEDIFDLQDELMETISVAVDAELASTEQTIAHRKSAADLDAWDHYQRGMWHFNQRPIQFAEAWQQFRKAVELAPEFATAHAQLAYTAIIELINDRSEDRSATLEQGFQDAKRAVSLDNRDSFSHLALGRIYTVQGDMTRAIPELKTSIELNPNSPLGHFGLGFALINTGRADEAIVHMTRSIRLSPRDGMRVGYISGRAFAHLVMDRHDEAMADANAAAPGSEISLWSHLHLAYLHAAQGDLDQARTAYDEAKRRSPRMSVAHLRHLLDNMHPPYLEKYLAGLKDIGLPEE